VTVTRIFNKEVLYELFFSILLSISVVIVVVCQVSIPNTDTIPRNTNFLTETIMGISIHV